ncbi:MAG: GtrA family protein [Acetatifactor sp.]|nr:GtrA family protein [Acetatifactor sp.]
MNELWNKVKTNIILKFLIVGGCSTGIDFVIYILLSMKLPITLSKGISMIISSIFSYIANKSFTFENKDKTDVWYIIRFYLVFGANLGTNLGVNYLVFNCTGYKLLAYLAATICGMTVNYLGQKFLVFMRKV